MDFFDTLHDAIDGAKAYKASQLETLANAADLSPTGIPKTLCNDGTMSASFDKQGTCSHHEGEDSVGVWTQLKQKAHR